MKRKDAHGNIREDAIRLPNGVLPLKDQIVHESTEIVVGCYSRGRLFFECGPGSSDSQIQAARELLDQFPCLSMDNYAIYTRAEWVAGYQPISLDDILRFESAARQTKPEIKP